MERLRRALRGGDLPVGEAMHPVALVAVIVLVVNDWVLKPRFHDWLTGKLSDVAGLVFAPVVLSALIGLVTRRHLTHRRLVACCLATALGFTLVKLVAPVRELAARALGHGAEFYPDWTDLLCLPAVLVAYWIGRDELRRLSITTRS
ncbi:MAG: hypothetical protein ACM31C_32380 [Acidobacteriota bacterium]